MIKTTIVLLITLASLATSGASPIEMPTIDLNGYNDSELESLEKQTDQLENQNKFEKKKNKLSKKRTKELLKFIPRRAETVKEFNRYNKIDAIASEYISCLDSAEDESECQELESQLELNESWEERSRTEVKLSPALRDRFEELLRITKDSFPGFRSSIVIKIFFNQNGVSELVKVENYEMTTKLSKFLKAFNMFVNKYPFHGPENQVVQQLVRFN